MLIGQHIRANGIRLHLLHFPGPGPRILVLPGITSPAITWAFVAERLRAQYDVYVLDIRGRGLSQSGDIDYSLDTLAADAVAVARHLGEPVVLGHSMGARIALRAARWCPDAFARLILADPPVSGPGRRRYPAAWSGYEEAITAARAGCGADEMRRFLPEWSDEHLCLRAEWLHTCDLAAVRAAYDSFHADDIHSDLACMERPVRLVLGGASPVVQEGDVAELRQLAPHLELRVVQGAGHMIPWDDLDGFIRAVAP